MGIPDQIMNEDIPTEYPDSITVICNVDIKIYEESMRQ